MRAVVQRCDDSSVSVDGELIASIGNGLMVLLGVGREDDVTDARYLAEKIVNLRIFPDVAGKMNLSLLDVGGRLLAVSQFTLFGDCRKGRRPSFDAAAPPGIAQELYEDFVEACREQGVEVCCGRFQTEMVVRLTNHGPVTMIIDSKRQF